MGKLLDCLADIIRREQVEADAAVERANRTEGLLDQAEKRRADKRWDRLIKDLNPTIPGGR